MKIEIIKDVDQLKQYKDKWQEILQEQNNDITFIELDWIVTWWSYFGQQYELFIIMGKEDNKILGFCPFMMIQKRGYKEITFVGNPQASYMDFIMKDEYKEEVIPGVMDFLFQLQGKYVFDFYGMFEDCISYKIINQYLHQHKIPCFTRNLVCYYQRVNEEFESYFNRRFRKKTQNTMRRKENRLNNLGKIKFQRLELQNMEQVFRMHDKRWKRKIGNSEFSEGKTELFFKELVLREDCSFKTTIDVIKLNDKVISFIYGFTCRGRYIFYRIAHDDDFYLFSPGEIVLREKIKQCSEKGINIFDFGVGYEPYKEDWAEQWVNVKTLIFANNSLVPQMIYRKYEGIRRIKSWLKKSKTIVNFKKHTLGKIKYKLSQEYRTQQYNKWKRTVQKQGILRFIMRPMFRKEKYLISHKKLSKIGGKQFLKNSYELRELTIGDLYTIADIIGEKPSSIVRKLSMEHRFFIVRKKDKVIFHCWVGFNTIDLIPIKQKRKIKKKEAMIYDINFLKHEDAIEIWENISKDLHSKGYQDLYIGCTGKQKKILQGVENMGFHLIEKISMMSFLGKTYIQVEKE